MLSKKMFLTLTSGMLLAVAGSAQAALTDGLEQSWDAAQAVCYCLCQRRAAMSMASEPFRRHARCLSKEIEAGSRSGYPRPR